MPLQDGAARANPPDPTGAEALGSTGAGVAVGPGKELKFVKKTRVASSLFGVELKKILKSCVISRHIPKQVQSSPAETGLDSLA